MQTDFRARDSAPLSAEEWTAVDAAAHHSARGHLIGRRFLAIHGPVGAGFEYVDGDRFAAPQGAIVSLLSEHDTEDRPPLGPSTRAPLPLPLVYRDLRLYWRDLERARHFGAALDLSGVIAAAAEVADAEDRLVFLGDKRLGVEGILTAAGAQVQPLSAWTAPGDGFNQITRGVELLLSAGHPGPYTLVLSPELFARLQRVSDLTGTLEIAAVEKLVRGAVLPANALAGTGKGAVLLDASAANLDLAIGIDLTVAYAGTDVMNHRLRVLETVVPRIKRPSAILRLEPQAG